MNLCLKTLKFATIRSPAGQLKILYTSLKILKFPTITSPHPLKVRSKPIDLDKSLLLQEHKIIGVVYVSKPK
jgi:hypothetical protein